MAVETGDLMPRASGSASLGVEMTNGGSTADIRPYANVHMNSGVFHAQHGQSGVIRFSQPNNCFEVSLDGGLTFDCIAVGQLGHYAQSFSNTSSVNVTHNLSSLDVIVQVRDNNSPPEIIIPDSVQFTDINNVDIAFNGLCSGRVVVIGSGVVDSCNADIFINSRRYSLWVS